MIDPLGHLVEFIDKNRIVLGLVQSSKNRRLGLITAGDRQVALPEGRALFICPSALSPERPRDELVAYLRQEESRREELARGVDVAELWELVHEESEPLPPADLAELVFGRPVTPGQVSALLRALFNERLHFRLAGEGFEPLSAEQLAQKAQQQEREAMLQAEMDAGVAYLRSLPAQGPCPEPPPALAKLLSDLVVFEDEAPQARKAKDMLAQVDLGGKRQVFDLLVRLGVYAPHQNLDLLREGYVQEFSPEALAQAAELDPVRALDGGREDLTELYAFTIDGAFTTDFDDALSFTPDAGGGGELGVHITDAAAILPRFGPLDQEAMGRGSSLYLPDVRIPMLPPSLSEDALSLREGLTRPAISWLVRLDAEGRVLDWRLTRSLLKVHRRHTYDEVDELLAVDPRLGGLHRLMRAFKAQRAQAGAYFLPLPEVILGVDPEWQVWVKRIDRDGPSRDMVAETAILANWLGSRFLSERGIPALFRTQAPSREPIMEGAPDDLYLHFKQRRLLNRVELTAEPGLHAMLGVTPYTHLTSPIRRYLDLVMQRQMTAALAGEPPPYSPEELRHLAQTVEPSVRRGMKIRQARQRYWLLRWLEARQGESLPALVMEGQPRRWSLLLTDIMLLTSIPAEAGRGLVPGQEVEIKPVKVDAFYDVLRVALA
jgi:exoribonuclease-2